MVTNFDYLSEKLPLLDLTNLKVSVACIDEVSSLFQVIFVNSCQRRLFYVAAADQNWQPHSLTASELKSLSPRHMFPM